MKTPIALTILIATSFVALPAIAGTATNPEFTDAAGDAADSVDLVSGWVQTTATDVLITVKVSDLSEPSPLLDNEGSFHNYYRVEFNLGTARYFAEAQIHGIDSSSTAGVNLPRLGGLFSTAIGTGFMGGRIGVSQPYAGSVTVDTASDTILMKIPRGSIFAPGAVMSQITAATYQNDEVHETTDATINSHVGGLRVQTDSATALASRTVTL